MQDLIQKFISFGFISFALILFGSTLTGCSPTDPTPKIAEEQREVLKDAEAAAASIEESAAKMQQNIDAESN
jgi:hypothetical protein